MELCLEESPGAARAVTHRGLLRLFALRLTGEFRRLVKEFLRDRLLQLGSLALPDGAKMAEVFAERAFELCFLTPELEPLRDSAQFESRIEQCKANLFPTARALLEALAAAMHGLQLVRGKIDTLGQMGYADTLNDVQAQLDLLFASGFVSTTSVRRLGHYERYLRAIEWRLDKVEEDPRRDYRRQDEIRPFQQANEQLAALAEPYRSLPEVAAFGWLLQEYRVSVFAQHLGTAEPASAKRLRQRWQAARSALAGHGADNAILDRLSPP